jgi:hypothetical protein
METINNETFVLALHKVIESLGYDSQKAGTKYLKQICEYIVTNKLAINDTPLKTIIQALYVNEDKDNFKTQQVKIYHTIRVATNQAVQYRQTEFMRYCKMFRIPKNSKTAIKSALTLSNLIYGIFKIMLDDLGMTEYQYNNL